MSWSLVQKLVEGAGQHSTLIGKFWITTFFVLRFLLVIAIAKSTWGDAGAFVCNTQSPGCKNVCFNSWNPITPIRWWMFQLLGVSLVSIIFNVYTTHKMALVSKAIEKKKKAEEKKQQALEARIEKLKEKKVPTEADEKIYQDLKEKSKKIQADEKLQITKYASDDNSYPTKLYLAYFTMVFGRLIIELAFIVGQYYIYSFKFVVPELFQCRHWPCPNVVDCFVSRPKEKTIMICLFYGTGVIMLILNIMELYQISGHVSEAWSKRGEDITRDAFSDDFPMFEMEEFEEWAPGAEGVYRVPATGYPNTSGIPNLMSRNPHGGGAARYGKSSLGYRRGRRGYR